MRLPAARSGPLHRSAFARPNTPLIAVPPLHPSSLGSGQWRSSQPAVMGRPAETSAAFVDTYRCFRYGDGIAHHRPLLDVHHRNAGRLARTGGYFSTTVAFGTFCISADVLAKGTRIFNTDRPQAELPQVRLCLVQGPSKTANLAGGAAGGVAGGAAGGVAGGVAGDTAGGAAGSVTGTRGCRAQPASVETVRATRPRCTAFTARDRARFSCESPPARSSTTPLSWRASSTWRGVDTHPRPFWLEVA